MEASKSLKRSKTVRIGDREMNSASTDHLSADLLKSVRSKFPNNYFGLPPYSLQQSSSALTYKSRAPLHEELLMDESSDYLSSGGHHHGSQTDEKSDTTTKNRAEHGSSSDGDPKGDSNYTAQRKVASALLTMVSNEIMVQHFLHKGGLTAVLRIVSETKDLETLLTCAQSLMQASVDPTNCAYLVSQNIFAAVQVFIDVANDPLKHRAAQILANLSSAPDMEELLVLNGILALIQNLNNHAHRTDTMCMLLLSLSNISPAVTAPESAEQVMRICFQNTQKLDIVRSQSKAMFVSDVLNNFSRLSHYSSMLVEEGVLPLLLHMIDSHPIDEVLRSCAEALANLSTNRKNRREISSSGFAGRLTLLFDRGSSVTRSSVLLVLGNLLSSNLFHDKVAHQETIQNILDKQLDLALPKQFNAVAYCLCQLAKLDTSCAVLVQCGAIPLMLRNLRKAPKESLDYLWSILTCITSFDQFFSTLMKHVKPLLVELYEEVRFDSSSVHQQMSVVQIGLNLSRRPDFSSFLNQELIDKFVQTMKVIFSSRLGTATIQMSALAALISFNQHCREARSTTLGGDLIELFQEVGIEDDKMNVRYVGLLNIISNEESCCYKLLERGAQKMLVSLQDSFTRLAKGGGLKKAKKKKHSRKESLRNMNVIMEAINNSQQQISLGLLDGNDSDGSEGHMGFTPAGKQKQKGGGVVHHGYLMPADGTPYEYDAAVEGELGKELTAATLHNLTLKRPVGAPGVLLTLLNLARNCKTLRVLHCIRSLANMSAHPKAKVMLSKEAPRILPMLTVTMRCGCMDAEKVQHYCAVTLCNMLAAPLDKGLMTDLIKTGAIVDLVVVTLLRINSLHTKETLAKAFFNFLNRSEIRDTLVLKLDMMAALLELAKHEYVELLELCMKALYNITCELEPGSGFEEAYANKLSQLKVPQMVVGRLVYTPTMEGSIGTRGIRYLLGKIVANMSYNSQLVVELTNSYGTNAQGSIRPGSIADALYRVYVLNMDETTFCACSTLYNISRIPECRVLADSGRALKLLVEVLSNEIPADCTRLCAATLCNFSTKHVFFESMSTHEVMQRVIAIIASPQMHRSIKMDAVQTVYNLVTAYPAVREVFVHNDGVVALWRVLKVQGSGGKGGPTDAKGVKVKGDDASVGSSSNNSAGEAGSLEDEEAALILIAHIMRELCEVIYNIKYEKKMLGDGAMNIILKLAKVEVPLLKLDMSFCLYSVCRMHDTMRVLKSDAIDICFWLTLHDTLNLQDVINKNTSRAMRCFAGTIDEAKVMVRQERFVPTLKELIKSKNEDVLWQTAGVLYSMMQIEYCLKILLERDLVDFIFAIAASGYESVRHVCSACLHMIPENMPNMEDPVVLELVLCLLEAQGDKFSELSEKPNDLLPYSNYVETIYAGSALEHPGTGFKASWLPQSCEVDSVFSPALIPTPIDSNLHVTLPSVDSASFSNFEVHSKILRAHYNDFKKDITSGSVSTTGSSVLGAATSDAGAVGQRAEAPPHRNASYPTTLLDSSATMLTNEAMEEEAETARRQFATDSNFSINIAAPAVYTPKPPSAADDDAWLQQQRGRGAATQEERSRSGSPQHSSYGDDDFEAEEEEEEEDVGMVANVEGSRAGANGRSSSGSQHRKHSRGGGSGRASVPDNTATIAVDDLHPEQLSKLRLPMIAGAPSVPDDTVGALTRSIQREAKQHQHHATSAPQLSMSANLETPGLLLPPESRGASRAGSRPGSRPGGNRPDPAANAANNSAGHSRHNRRSADASGAARRKNNTKKVIQISNNDHGNIVG